MVTSETELNVERTDVSKWFALRKTKGNSGKFGERESEKTEEIVFDVMFVQAVVFWRKLKDKKVK